MANERLWALDKDEMMTAKRYFASLWDIWDEVNVVIRERWKDVERNCLLTKSILRRLSSFYSISYKFAKQVGNRALGTITGPYFEDVVFCPLEAFMKPQFKDVSLERNKTIKNVKLNPDISVYVQGRPFYAIEAKVWMDKGQIDDVKKRREKLGKIGVQLACVTLWLYSRDRDRQKNESWIYMLSKVPVDRISRYEPEIYRPIEELFKDIKTKAQAFTR